MSNWENEYPASSEYAHFYADYVSHVPKKNIIHTLNEQMHEVYTLMNAVRGDKAFIAYSEGKWTLKQLLGHLIETERMFAYRALSFSRGDQSKLPGMEQDEWIKNGNYNERTIANLCNEYLAVRTSTIHLFNNMTPEMINREGYASEVKFTVRAIAFIIAGHERHHLQVVHNKYLPDN